MRTNRVGRSAVSAITQTPASGPRASVTTPPMSSWSIAIAAADWPTAVEPRQAIAERPSATNAPASLPVFIAMRSLPSETGGVAEVYLRPLPCATYERLAHELLEG